LFQIKKKADLRKTHVGGWVTRAATRSLEKKTTASPKYNHAKGPGQESSARRG